MGIPPSAPTALAAAASRTPGKPPAGRTAALSSGRKKLLSRRKLGAGGAIGGGAVRVSAFDSGAASSSDEEDEQGGGGGGGAAAAGGGAAAVSRRNPKRPLDGSVSGPGSAAKPPPKISKMDLSYMLNWEPTAHRKNSVGANDADDKKLASLASAPAMEKIEEEPSTSSAELSKDSSSIHTASSKASHERTSDASRHRNQTSDSHGSSSSERSQQSKHQDARPPLPAQHTSAPDSGPHLSPKRAALAAKSNLEFLPLVSEDNIIAVNGTSYAKLGVIGRGGSCKVYRALSRDCQVLAIKKVKLAGMDKKTIASYANEIRLLKSLRGNPAIIQLYDSEVDLQRKAIFLAMELGEVDLNHVLQQQEVLDGEKGDGEGGKSSCRNMNFIRLTWQQMLSAVHSIHEERIIHGDLKPANFLFVRGALKLIDFGIAKSVENDDTTNIYRDSQIGTLNYMSPESILDTGTGPNGARMKCGRPSDVWALGCILYQMCYGRTPFAELRMIQKLQAIVDPKHEISFPTTVDEAAIDAIRLCLRRRSEDRAPIVGENGLLNEHWFLHSGKRRK